MQDEQEVMTSTTTTTTNTTTKNPFAALLLPPRRQFPSTQRAQLVVNGQRVVKGVHASTLLHTPGHEDDDQRAEKRAIRRQRELIYYRTRYQRMKQDPEWWAKEQAVRRAWREANQAKLKAYRQQYLKDNAERLRVSKTEWQRRKRAQLAIEHPEKIAEARAKSLAYYRENKDAIKARKHARKVAASRQVQENNERAHT